MIDKKFLNKFLNEINNDIDNDIFIKKFEDLILNGLTQADYKKFLEDEFK